MKASLMLICRHMVFATAVCLTTFLIACGAKERPASQVAAKVNKEEISVHQINFILQRQQGIRPEDADSAGKVILERLIDQELAVQKAEELKLDREPQIVQALEASKREVLARAYQDRLTENITKPTDEELRSYFESKPALFKGRRIYQLDELSIDVAPDKVAGARKSIESLKSLTDITSYLKTENFSFSETQATRAAEQLPLTALDAFSRMVDGQNTVSEKPGGLQAVILMSSRSQPVSFERAKLAIEQYLVNAQKRDLLEKNIKDLRVNSKIEYIGTFANGHVGSKPEGTDYVAVPLIASVPSAASASLDASTITKGMGIK